MNVDISIAEDTLGLDSKLPCNVTVNETFDDCAYDQESCRKYNNLNDFYISYYFSLVARNYVVKAWLHSPMDAGPNNMHP